MSNIGGAASAPAPRALGAAYAGCGDLNQLPAGDKIIGFDPKDKKNTQNTAMKRNIEIFGEENVIPPAECEGWKTKKKFKTDKGIVIERLVCDKPRV